MTIKTTLQQWFGDKADPRNQKIVQIAKTVIIVALLLSLFSIIPIPSVWEVIQASNPYLLIIGIFLGLPSIYARSILLGLITQKQGLALSFNRLFRVNMVIKFYLLFLPGGLVGSGLRWAKVSQYGKSAETLGAIAYNRVIEFFVVIISGIFLYLVGVDQEIMDFNILILFVLGLFVGFFIFLYSTRILTRLFEKSTKKSFKHGFVQKVWEYFDRVLNSMKIYSELTIKESLLIFGASFFGYILILASYILIARSIGIDISIFDLGWTHAVVFFAAFTPLSIAGGLGIRDVSLVFMLSLFGVDPEVALAFSLLIFSRGVFLSLIGGMVALYEVMDKKRIEN